MKTDVLQTLTLIDLARAGISLPLLKEHDPALVTFGTEHGLIRIIPARTANEPDMVHLTGTALEHSLELRDAGNPIFGIDIHPYGLTLRQDLTQEQWLITLQRLRVIKSAYHNVLADMVTYGRSHFGSTFVDQSIEQLEFAFDDINHAENIAHVPRLLRQSFPLTSEHYYVLGLKFPTDHQSQELWAQRTQQHKLSPHNLKRSIESDRILTDESLRQLTGSGSGMPILQGISLPFSRWSSTVGGIEKVKTWDAEKRAAVLLELTPLVEFALTLRATLDPTEEE